MTVTMLERPTFHEGQILGASDLDGVVEHARNALSRHERYAHTAGIAGGLELGGADDDVTLSAGVAIDAGGRQIVVGADIDLIADEFAQINGADVDEKAWYPVFVRGRDQIGVDSGSTFDRCGTGSGATTVSEMATVEYGRLGDARNLPDPFPGTVADGPAEISGRVLVGYVKWSPSTGRFTETATAPPGEVPVAFVGVAAAVVAPARGGRVEIRTGSTPATSMPAVRVDDGDGGSLAFGLLDGSGGMEELFTVDASGNVTAKGTVFEGSLVSGSAQVESGVATDGVRLPLPAGVTEEQVDSGAVTIHTHLTPMVPATARPATAGDWVEVTVECEADADRRVRCQTRWIDLGGVAAAQAALPGACRYLLVAAVPTSQ